MNLGGAESDHLPCEILVRSAPPAPAREAVVIHESSHGLLNIQQLPPMTEDAVLTIPEVAALLKISQRTIYAMAKEGCLPGAGEVRGSWRVLCPKLMGWLETNTTPAGPERTDTPGGGKT